MTESNEEQTAQPEPIPETNGSEPAVPEGVTPNPDAVTQSVAGEANAVPSQEGSAIAGAHDRPVVDEVPEGELPLALRSLVDAGVHFGHQTNRWNPKMSPYIYGSRNGIHIVDLDQTAQLFARAFQFVVHTVARGGHVLFVGTKRQGAEVIHEEARRAEQFFVTGRWLGGTLTNFTTVKRAIERLRDLDQQEADGEFELYTKKEAIRLRREQEKLEKFIGGIKMMNSLPSCLYVIDPNNEHIAVKEARKLRIPIVALTDTNCDPDAVDFVIPGNDDAIRSIKLITSRIADACIIGSQRRSHQARDAAEYGVPSTTSEGVQVEFQRSRRAQQP